MHKLGFGGKSQKKSRGTAQSANAFGALHDEDAAPKTPTPTPAEDFSPIAEAPLAATAESPTLEEQNNKREEGWSAVQSRRQPRARTSTVISPVQNEYRPMEPDWVDPTKVNWRETRGQPTTLIGTARRFNGTLGRAPSRGTRRTTTQRHNGHSTIHGIPLSALYAGIITWHLDKRPCLDPSILASDSRIFTDQDGLRWLRKGRYWVIIARTRETVTEAPIYSYGDKGLTGKDPSVVDFEEFNSVRPPNVVDFTNQSPNQEVLQIEWLEKDDEKLRATIVVHVTEAITRSINVGEVRVVGGMTGPSTATFVRRVREVVGTVRK